MGRLHGEEYSSLGMVHRRKNLFPHKSDTCTLSDCFAETEISRAVLTIFDPKFAGMGVLRIIRICGGQFLPIFDLFFPVRNSENCLLIISLEHKNNKGPTSQIVVCATRACPHSAKTRHITGEGTCISR